MLDHHRRVIDALPHQGPGGDFHDGNGYHQSKRERSRPAEWVSPRGC
jgi:hypothetical protein